MAGIASQENGKKGGRPKGRRNNSTLEREDARRAYQQLVLQNIKPLFDSQFSLARGVSYVYRIDRHKKKGEPTRIEHVLLEDPREIADALDIIANDDENGDDEGNGFYYITTKAPENKAIDSLLDRTFGRAQQSVDVTTAGQSLIDDEARAKAKAAVSALAGTGDSGVGE